MRNDPQDTLMYATFVSTAIQERNPLRQALREIVQRVRNILFFRKNLKAITVRRQELEQRLEFIRMQIDDPAHRHRGQKINKLR